MNTRNPRWTMSVTPMKRPRPPATVLKGDTRTASRRSTLSTPQYGSSTGHGSRWSPLPASRFGSQAASLWPGGVIGITPTTPS